MIFGLIFTRRIIIDGLNNGKIVEKIIDEICSKDKIYSIKQIQMPLLISMVDLQKGTVYIASSKEVRASCSFPVVFSPCRYNRIQLIDGGTRENLPWKGLKEIGADEVFGISFNTIFKEKDCCKNIIDVAARAMELQDRKLTMYEKTGIDNLITIN